MAYALEGITVVDLTSGVAGPFCTKVLAGLGAEVVKIERPWGGDPARKHGSFLGDVPNPETSALFLDLNMGKKSVTLDVATPEGMRIVKELARTADFFVEDFKPGAARDVGLGYEVLEGLNPALVYTSVSGFGQTGPYRDYVGSDMVFFATGGEMYSTGEPERPPIRVANFVNLTQAGNMAAAASLMALRHVRRTGAGQYIDVSAFEVAVSSVDRRLQYLTGYAYTGRIGNRADSSVSSYPAGIYPCKDGFFHITGGGRRFFPRSAAMMGMPEMTQDPRFSTTEALMSSEMKDEFDTIFVPWVISRTKRECLDAAREHRVYGSPLLTPEDVVHDEHYEARGYFQTIDHPATGRRQYPGAPAKTTRTPWRLERAPLLGEHNVEVLVQRLGYSPADLVRLEQSGGT